MSLHTFKRKGLTLSYYDNHGEGTPLVVQHGLTADYNQAETMYPDNIRRCITLECRAHGGSEGGDASDWSIETFAEDLRALLKFLKIERAVLCGISMGAAICLAFASKYPKHVADLVLIRPAWADKPIPENIIPFKVVADLIDLYGCEDGFQRYVTSNAYDMLKARSPDNANSLISLFSRETQTLMLRAITSSKPIVNVAILRKNNLVPKCIHVERDYIHPYSVVNDLMKLMPGMMIYRASTKIENPNGYIDDCKSVISKVLGSIDVADKPSKQFF